MAVRRDWGATFHYALTDWLLRLIVLRERLSFYSERTLQPQGFELPSLVNRAEGWGMTGRAGKVLTRRWLWMTSPRTQKKFSLGVTYN